MKEIWTNDTAEYHGELVDVPLMTAPPKLVPKPHPPIIVGGAYIRWTGSAATSWVSKLKVLDKTLNAKRVDMPSIQYAARRAIRYGDGLIPRGADAGSGDPEDYMPRFRRMAEEAGRDPRSLPVTLGGAPEDADRLKRYRDIGIARMNVCLPAANTEEILPILDRWAKLIRQVLA